MNCPQRAQKDIFLALGERIYLDSATSSESLVHVDGKTDFFGWWIYQKSTVAERD